MKSLDVYSLLADAGGLKIDGGLGALRVHGDVLRVCDARDAVRHVEEGHARGKVIIDLDRAAD